MRYVVLAADYDGTLAEQGQVSAATIAALQRLRDSGRRLVLVTGRRLDDLLTVFDWVDLFDKVVAENGAYLHDPAAQRGRLLAEAVPPRLVQALQERGVRPLEVGRAIVATAEANDKEVLEIIHDLGLEQHLVFNKGAVMVLPPGVTKATGLKAALTELRISERNVVAVGDGENDHALADVSECFVAVANAVPALKERADLITSAPDGTGVAEIVGGLLDDDLAGIDPPRQQVQIGTTRGGEAIKVSPFGTQILVAGPSGSGKSTTATSIVERIAAAGYQVCILDPEGDYDGYDLGTASVTLGDGERYAHVEEVGGVLESSPHQSVMVNLVGLTPDDRPPYLQALLALTHELQRRCGRPHWLVIDEAHHFLPAEASTPFDAPEGMSVLALTIDPRHVSAGAVSKMDLVIAVTDSPGETLRAAAEALGGKLPTLPSGPLGESPVVMWDRELGRVEPIQVPPPRAERQRHRRKYAKGELGDDDSFYFRGARGELNLKAQNLTLFSQIARGVDDETWNHHLREGDYSKWFAKAIKDDELAEEARRIEQQRDLTAKESRDAVLEAIERRYTVPE